MSTKLRGFLPYIIVVFVNAFVDLGHKIVIQNAIFKSYDGNEQVILTAIVNGLILLPFILLFSPSGFLADKFAKHRIIRHSALFAVVATCLITLAYYQGWFWVAFALTFALAVQSAIYSPAKYGYIKELVGAKNLASANGLVQAVTIAGILLGTFVFSILFEALLPASASADTDQIMSHIAPIGWILVALASFEWVISHLLPARQQQRTEDSFELSRYLRLQYLRRNLSTLRGNNAIWLSIVGLATFWAISQVMLAAFPAFAKDALGITNTVVIQGVLACSGLGIVLGSLIAGRASRNYIELGLIPIGALGIAIGIMLLPSLQSAYSMGATFFLVGVMGGMFIVPLNSLIQFQSEPTQLGTVLAGNNWIQNITMAGALVLTVFFSILGLDSASLFYILTLVAVIGTGYTVRKLPQSLARYLAMGILKRRYRIEVLGFEHIPQSGATLLLGNHISWIDWALVQIACPRPIRFIMLKRIYDTWYLKPFFKAFGVVPIAAGQSEKSLEKINQLLRAGECVCLFPEGAISRNGQLGKFHTGYERAVSGVEDGVIIPFYLHGLWGSSLSRADEGLKRSRMPDIKRDLIVAFGPPLPLDTSAKQLKQKVFELSITAWDAYSSQLPTVPLAWLRSARRNLFQLTLIDDAGNRLKNHQLVSTVFALGKHLHLSKNNPNIGVMLTPGAASTQAILATLLKGGAVVPVNHMLPTDVLQGLLEVSSVKQIVTSRAYLQQLKEQGIDVSTALSNCELIHMEDLALNTSWWRNLFLLGQFALLPVSTFYRLHGRPVATGSTAAIMLPDTTESSALGVKLTHKNIITNCKQVSDVLNTRTDDVMLSCIPIYHSFGFTVASIMPLIEGVPVACHADVDDFLGIAKTAARCKATILPASRSALEDYAANEAIHPLMLKSVRLVVTGGAVVNNELREGFELKFAKHIYEGFTLAEATSVAAVNIPDAMDTSDWKVQHGAMRGSLGMPLPGTSLRIVDPDNDQPLPLGEFGQLLIRGSQVMQGYLGERAQYRCELTEIDEQRWLRTSHTACLTDEGFLVLQARSL